MDTIFLVILCLLGGLLLALVVGFMNAGLNAQENDPFLNCILYQKTLAGDNVQLQGKIHVTIHYYNATYICDGQFKSRVETSQ